MKKFNDVMMMKSKCTANKRPAIFHHKMFTASVLLALSPMALPSDALAYYNGAVSPGGTEHKQLAVPYPFPLTFQSEQDEQELKIVNGSDRLVFVDAGVSDYQKILNAIEPRAEVYFLHPDSNGVQQVADILSHYRNLHSVHVIAHGDEASIRLGTAVLSSETLFSYHSEMSVIQQALAKGADLMLYSCNTGRGERGHAFVDELALVTGADVAASDNLTGSKLLGGDWELEVRHGDIESDEPWSAAALKDFTHVLATETLSAWTDQGTTVTDQGTLGASHFVVSGSVGQVNTNASGSGAFLADYATQNATGLWLRVDVDGSNLTAFQLTSLVLAEYQDSNIFQNISITGYVSGGGTVSGSAASGSIGPDAYSTTLTNFSGVNITGFKVTFDAAGGTFSSDLDIASFTWNAAVFNSPPTIVGASAGQTVNDTSTVSPFSSISIADDDGNNVTTTVTLDTNAKGMFTPASLSASGFTGTGPYSLSSSTPAAAQTAIRQLVFNPTDNRVTAGSTETTTFTIAVNDGTVTTNNNTTTVVATSINDAPVITSNGGGATASTSVNENSTAVTTVTASDADPSTTFTYSISGGVDQALFGINSSSGALAFASAPNYEAPADSGASNVYDVQVTVTDNGPGTLTDVQDIAITVNNINDTPVITSDGGGATASVNAAENQTSVTTVTATDQDTADTLTYSISGGADAAKFSINSSTGVLTFASAPNYESPTDSGSNGVYDVQVTVTDNGSGTLTDVQAIAVTVTNVNEAPVITSNGGGASASSSVNENSTAVTTVTATDVDTSDTLTYSISGGADAAKFAINSSTGAMVFSSAPDYENPTDSGANNVYDVQVTVTDNGTGNLTDVQAIAVTINNVNENPVITSDGGGTSASVNAQENQTSVTTVVATDQDSADTLTYSLTGGADQATFNINSSSGVLTFAVAPNYESPTDSGANGVYDVQVTVIDDGAGTLTDVQNIAVTVTNANENPVITSNGGGASAVTSINENTTAVTTVTETDVDTADTHTFSLSGGADTAKFNINSSSGALTFASAPSYETPTDSGANNVYDVQVTVTDSGTGNLTDVQDIAVTINNVNETPVITSDGGGASASVNAQESQTSVTTVVATDQDSADTLTYSLTGGADQAKFNINSSSGVLTFAVAPNYESPTDSGADGVYDVQVTVIDDGAGTLTDVQNIAVTVTNANDDPTISSLPTDITVVEDTASNVDLSGATLSDVDSGANSITLTIAAGGGTLAATSAGGVTVIGSGTGTLTLTGTVDNIDTFLNVASNIQYTGAANVNGNDVTTLTLTANDGGNTGTGGGTNVALGTVNVDITAVNDAPTFTGTPTITGTAKVGQTLGLTDTGTDDVDGDTVSLSYQWKVDDTDITGAISSTYVSSKAENKKDITCTITADDGNGGVTTFTTSGINVGGFPWLLLMPGLSSPNKIIK